MKQLNYNNMKLVQGKLVPCNDRSRMAEVRENNPEESTRVQGQLATSGGGGGGSNPQQKKKNNLHKMAADKI